MGATISEKILARASGRRSVEPGEIVMATPDVTVIHDVHMWEYVHQLREIGLRRVIRPDRIIQVFDHNAPAASEDYAERHKIARDFCREFGIQKVYDVGRNGISHQFLHEEGYALPGAFYASNDVHAVNYGAVGCFASGFGTGVVEIMATGQIWVRVPESIRVVVEGEPPPGVTSRDLMQQMLGEWKSDGALYKVVEFTGPAIEKMSIDFRLALCNRVVYAGAKTAIMAPNSDVLRLAAERAAIPYEPLYSDADARYVATYRYRLSDLEPLVAAPGDPRNTKPVREVEGTTIHQGFIGSCSGGRLEEMELALKILDGRKVARNVRLLVIPPSQEIYLKMAESGMIARFARAGASVGSPSCGPCNGYVGLLAAGEVCIATGPINTPGRMGSHQSEIYLANAAVVAASAVEGRITNPAPYLKPGGVGPGGPAGPRPGAGAGGSAGPGRPIPAAPADS